MLTSQATSMSTPLFTTKAETTTNSVSNTSATTSIVSTPLVTTEAATTTINKNCPANFYFSDVINKCGKFIK